MKAVLRAIALVLFVLAAVAFVVFLFAALGLLRRGGVEYSWVEPLIVGSFLATASVVCRWAAEGGPNG